MGQGERGWCDLANGAKPHHTHNCMDHAKQMANWEALNKCGVTPCDMLAFFWALLPPPFANVTFQNIKPGGNASAATGAKSEARWATLGLSVFIC